MVNYGDVINGVKDVGFPIALVIYILFIYSSKGTKFDLRLDKLSQSFETFIQNNSESTTNLIKQNNFMLYAMMSLIVGKKENAKTLMKKAIVEFENRDSSNPRDPDSEENNDSGGESSS